MILFVRLTELNSTTKCIKNSDLSLLYFRTYIYVRNPKTVATPVRIYMYTDFAIEIWGFYQRLSDTLRYHHTRCSRASGLLASITSDVYQSEEKWSLLEVVRCSWRVLENYYCRTKFNSSLGMEYNGELYGFSAVKVKLVDSLIIWRMFILTWIRPRKPMTRPIWHMCEFLFWTVRSLILRTFIDDLCFNCY